MDGEKNIKTFLKKNRRKIKRLFKKHEQEIAEARRYLKFYRIIWKLQFDNTNLKECITWLVELLNDNNGTLCEHCVYNDTNENCDNYDKNGSCACCQGIINYYIENHFRKEQ